MGSSGKVRPLAESFPALETLVLLPSSMDSMVAKEFGALLKAHLSVGGSAL